MIKLLNNQQTLFAQCPSNTQFVSAPLIAPGNTVQLTSVSNIISPGQTQTPIQDISGGNRFSALLNWTSGQLSLELISPSGSIINSTTYQTFQNVTFDQGTFLNTPFVSFTFELPEQGNWTLKVKGTGISAPTTYTLSLVMDKNISLDVNTDTNSYLPGKPIKITAKLQDITSPFINANLTTKITLPNGTTAQLIIFDDGLHNDSVANDGIYGNSFTATQMQGAYVISAITVIEQAVLEDVTTAFVELLPDLIIKSSDITFTPSSIVPGRTTTVTVSVFIKNPSAASVNNALIEFYDGNPAAGGKLFATASTSIPATSTASVSETFILPTLPAPSLGTSTDSGKVYIPDVLAKPYNITVVISSFANFIESDYSNNQASKILPVKR